MEHDLHRFALQAVSPSFETLTPGLQRFIGLAPGTTSGMPGALQAFRPGFITGELQARRWTRALMRHGMIIYTTV